MGKAVAVKEEAGLPAAFLAEMLEDSGDGSQNVTSTDMAIPFLRILQKMSPQLSKRDNAYVAGAEEGDIYNSVTGQIWGEKDNLVVIPTVFNFKTIEWKPRDSGGGFVATYARGEELPAHVKNDKGKLITNEGNILEDTAENYVLIYDKDTGSVEQALLAMSSTQLKHSRKWNSLISQKTVGGKPAPRYGYCYNLKTGVESNDHGDWAGWSITDAGMVESVDAYRAAKAFCASIGQGDVVVKHSQEEVM
jgi:asparagine N-glycosylation enzyme membrane subunit Stt3